MLAVPSTELTNNWRIAAEPLSRFRKERGERREPSTTLAPRRRRSIDRQPPLLRLEGAAVLIVSLLSYHWNHGSWLQFALLFLLPDLSMLGYVANIRVGAITYNAVHTYVGPLVLATYSFVSNRPAIVSLSLIWIAHIGTRWRWDAKEKGRTLKRCGPQGGNYVAGIRPAAMAS